MHTKNMKRKIIKNASINAHNGTKGPDFNVWVVWNGWTLKSCALTLSIELNILQFFKKTCSSISLKCVTIVLSFISSSKCSFEYLYFLVYRFFFVISVLPTKMSTQYPQPGKTIHISYRMYLKMFLKKTSNFHPCVLNKPRLHVE